MLKLKYEPKDAMEVYKTYMPFVKRGGLFIQTDEFANIGDEVSVHVKLPFHKEEYSFTSKVIWVNPKKSLTEKSIGGLGIQIPTGETQEIQHLIESNIEEYLNSEQPTDTM